MAYKFNECIQFQNKILLLCGQYRICNRNWNFDRQFRLQYTVLSNTRFLTDLCLQYKLTIVLRLFQIWKIWIFYCSAVCKTLIATVIVFCTKS